MSPIDFNGGDSRAGDETVAYLSPGSEPDDAAASYGIWPLNNPVQESIPLSSASLEIMLRILLLLF